MHRISAHDHSVLCGETETEKRANGTFLGRDIVAMRNFLLIEVVNPLVFTAFLLKNGRSYHPISRATTDIVSPDGKILKVL